MLYGPATVFAVALSLAINDACDQCDDSRGGEDDDEGAGCSPLHDPAFSAEAVAMAYRLRHPVADVHRSRI